MNPLRTLVTVTLALGVAATAVLALPKAEQMSAAPMERGDGAAAFDQQGRLLRPRGYRGWIYVGAPLTPNDMNDGAAAFPEFHSVYVDPATFEEYKRTGRWRDGTVVVKELISVGSKTSTSGKGYFMGEFLGLEAMVKSASRFPKEPGNWGFFRFTDEEGGPVHSTAGVLPTASCASCHSGSADDDLVFTQHYPVLRAAKGFGEGAPEDR